LIVPRQSAGDLPPSPLASAIERCTALKLSGVNSRTGRWPQRFRRYRIAAFITATVVVG